MTTRFGRYELVRVLGRGALGEVWQATLHGPHGFRKPVALKLLHGDPADRAVEFAQEARLGALLSHPNIVSTHELGEVDGRWFIAMELVRGGSVRDLLRRNGPLPARAVVEIGMQVAAGLAHVHRLEVAGRAVGLVHRDIKPANLLLTPDGLVKIADLGIARFAGTEHQALGTYGYMPAEQLEGREDARADLFALGVTLYRLIIDEPLFDVGPRAILAVADADAWIAESAAFDRVRAIHEGLAEVLARCVRSEPDARWPDALSLGQALGALVGPDLPGASLGECVGATDGGVPTISVERTVSRVRGRVAAPRDPFVGRGAELHALLQRLERDRLVTLTGTGGMGKTRLATEVARTVQRAWVGGAWFADASEARSAAGVCVSVARVLGVSLGGSDAAAALDEPLRRLGRALLVVDNVEQVVDEAAPLVSRWLDAAPELVILSTSQVPLRLRGERQVALRPLTSEEACALFRDRSGIDAQDEALRPWVDELDGLPLAIELAAARARRIGLDAVRRGLADRFRLLTSTERDRPARHRSLKASLEATWALLPPWGPAAMAQLATFADGFTLEAADAVLDLSPWPDAPWTIDALDQLLEWSLLQFDATGGRFRVLQSVQAHAREVAPQEAEAAELRHGTWFAQFGTPSALVAVGQRRGRELKQQLETELENVVVAARAAIRRGDGPIATACALAARRVLEVHGPIAAAEALLAEVEPIAGDRLGELQNTRAWLNLLLGRMDVGMKLAAAGRERGRYESNLREEGLGEMYLGLAAYIQGDTVTAVDAIRRAVMRFDELGDRYLQAVALQNLGVVYDGEPEDALAIYDATAVLAEALGDDQIACYALANIGRVRHVIGLPDAMAPLERALAVAVEQESTRQEGIVRTYMGNQLRDRLALDEARTQLQTATDLLRQVGDLRLLGYAMCILGHTELEAGRPEAALAIFDEALAVIDQMATGKHFLMHRAHALYALGRQEEAYRVLEDGIAWLRTLRDDRYLAYALALRAVWTGTVADLEEAERRIDGLRGEAFIHRTLAEARRRLTDGAPAP